MRVSIVDHAAGAARSRGIVVVIDVFRASTVQAWALARGARRILPVAGIDEARGLKREHPDWLLIGERDARPLPGFDAGNSPTQVLELPLPGATLVHTTHAGTQSLAAAARAPEARAVYSCGLVNLAVTAARIRALEPAIVTLVRAGHCDVERCAEDDLCAEWLTALLEGAATVPGAAEARARLRDAPAAAKFFDPAATWAPESDFDLATDVSALPVVVEYDPALGLRSTGHPP